MNEFVKDIWLKELRSGSYLQGQNFLRTNNMYCCFGVLCDVIDPSKWNGNIFSRSHYVPPRYIREYAGLTNEQEQTLVRMNDAGKTFKEIADYIEANY